MILKDFECIDGDALLEHLEEYDEYDDYCNPAPDGYTLYVEYRDIKELYETTKDEYFNELLQSIDKDKKYVLVMR